MRPIVIVEPTLPSTWGSCQTIIPNLVEMYRHFATENLEVVEYSRESTSLQVLATAHKIRALDPSHLVFVDHQKHPTELLAALYFVYARKAWPKIIIHVYGDFTLFTAQWAMCEGLLRDRVIHFVCASPRQEKMIAAFIQGGRKYTSVCPFPVLEADFKFAKGLRESERRRRGLSHGEFVMIYTGRLSLQKNILKMVIETARAAEKLGLNWRFLLAGSFDDIGSPFFGVRLAPGGYYQGFLKLLRTLAPEVRKRIEFLGALDKRELKALYHAGDLFVSFSTHHDEDYGMSPVEALACGVPALISDWGGFGGFAIDLESVTLMPVSLGGSGPQLDTARLTESLQSIQQRACSSHGDDRARRSAQFLKEFGLASAAEKIEAVVPRLELKFKGFTPLLRRHSKLIRQWPHSGRIYKIGKRLDLNYKTIYRNYLNETGI